MGNETSPTDQKTEDPQAPRLSVECCAHAYECQDSNCDRPFCTRIKRVLHHKMTCKRRTKGGCLICREISALCFDHVKHCKDDKCPAPVPFCLNLKKKLKRQQRHLRRLTTLSLRSTHCCSASSTGSSKTAHSSHKLRVKHTDERWERSSSGEVLLSYSPDLSANQTQGCLPGAATEVEVTLQDSKKLPSSTQTYVGKTHSPAGHMSAKDKLPFLQLVDALHATNSTEQQSRIVYILNNNPWLVKAYLMHRLCQAYQRLVTLQAQKEYLLSLNL